MRDRYCEWDEILLLEEWEATVPKEYRAHGHYPGSWREQQDDRQRSDRRPNRFEGAIILPWGETSAYPRQRLAA